jgi:hypothetical protein
MSKRAEIVYHWDGKEVPGLVCGRDGCESGHFLVMEDGQCIEDLGSDGGEPEDQRLCRDWSWVQALAQRALDAEDRIVELQSAAHGAPTWEANHQRAALVLRGLAEEFPWGCDAIGDVADALVQARALAGRLRREVRLHEGARLATRAHDGLRAAVDAVPEPWEPKP